MPPRRPTHHRPHAIAFLLGLAAFATDAAADDTTWLGGAGLWNDPSRWSNGVPNVNNVFIDGGDGVASVVTLSGDMGFVRNLDLDADDALNIESSLRFFTSPPAAFRNDGLVTLGTSTAGGILEFASGVGSLTLAGGGTIALSDRAGNVIRAFADDQTLINDAGHTIRGSGSIAAAVNPSFKFDFQNAGTLVADQGVPLTISPGLTFTNTGRLLAADGGTLNLRQSDLDPNASSGELVSVGGTFAATGAGSTINIEIPEASFDGDRFETSDGGTINFLFATNVNGQSRMKDVTFAGDGTIAVADGSRIDVEGTITNATSLTVGDPAGAGLTRLFLADDTMFSGGGTIDMRGTIAPRVGAFPTTLTNEDNTIQISGGINGLNVENRGTIRTGGGNLVLNLFNTGSPLLVTNQGTIEAIDGHRVTFASSGVATLDNRDGTITARGDGTTIRIALLAGSTISGGALEASGQGALVEVFSNPVGDATIRALDGGTVQLTGGLTNFDAPTQTLTGGTYEARAGTLQVAGIDVATNAATIVLDGAGGAPAFSDENGQDALRSFSFNAADGRLTIRNGVQLTTADSTFTNAGFLTIGAASSFTVGGSDDYLQTAGVTSLAAADSVLAVNDDKAVQILGGLLDGIGTVDGGLVNGGAVVPGNSPGVLTITGDYTQLASGLLDLQIGGSDAGAGFSQLVVGGRATLGGILNVTLTGGFLPGDGQSFLILATSELAGDFSRMTLFASPGVQFRFDRGAAGLSLVAVVVPEPASLVSHGLGLAGLTLLVRRRAVALKMIVARGRAA